MNRAMTKILTHTTIIIRQLKIACISYFDCHGELHSDYIGTGTDH